MKKQVFVKKSVFQFFAVFWFYMARFWVVGWDLCLGIFVWHVKMWEPGL
jgi:hypothetical protein